MEGKVIRDEPIGRLQLAVFKDMTILTAVAASRVLTEQPDAIRICVRMIQYMPSTQRDDRETTDHVRRGTEQ